MNAARAREREPLEALQKFRILRRVPSREADLASTGIHDIGLPTDVLFREAYYGALDSATVPETVDEPIRSARSCRVLCPPVAKALSRGSLQRA